MSGTISTTSGAVTSGATAVEAPKRGFGWRTLQRMAAAVAAGSLVLPMVVEGEFVGFLAAMAAPFVIGLLLAAFLPRTGAVFLGVVSLAIVGSSVPFLAEALIHPESLADFIPLVLLVVSGVVTVVAGVPAYREARGTAAASAAPRALAIAAVAVFVVASAVSVVSAAGVDDVAAQPGDVTMATRDFAFSPATITADAGTVGIHLTNDDKTRHTFTIDGVTDISVAPGQAQREAFDVQPGTYRFYCMPHESEMDGTLVVE
jgi:plastocyanin